MSRIHDALKKAELERATTAPQQILVAAPELAQPQQDLAPEVARIEGEPLMVQPDQHMEVGLSASFTGLAEHLRFDEIKKRCVRPEWNLDPNVNVFANPAMGDRAPEQFRTLRSRLHQFRAKQPLRTLLVTSAVPGEGKTFVTANLAQAIVRQADRRVLIVDADLRCPRVHALLGAPRNPGLSDYLRGEVDEIAAIQSGPEGNLCFIPGGNETTNPSELLSNGRLSVLLTRLAPIFDWIILDSPPCLPVADASILAGICDGVLLVVKAGSTPSAVAQRARQELETRNLVGVVLNAVAPSHVNTTEYYQAYTYAPGSSGSESA